ISYPYVIDGAELELGGMSTAELSRWFPSTELVHIGDGIADGVFAAAGGNPPPRPVPRPTPRFQPRPPAPLHRHAAGAFPAIRAVHQLCPLRRRVRPLRDRHPAPTRQPLHRLFGPRRCL